MTNKLYMMQVIASLLGSVLVLGYKLNVPKEILQMNQRRKELTGNLSLLQTTLDDEVIAAWIADVAHDTVRRQQQIAEMSSSKRDSSDSKAPLCRSFSGLNALSFSELETAYFERCLRMFALFDSSSGVEHLVHSPTIKRAETKRDARGVLLLRAKAEIRAAPEDIAAYSLGYIGSRHAQSPSMADANLVRAESVEAVNSHHNIQFIRYRIWHLSDRTFLNSVLVKKVAEQPPTFVVVASPIPFHEKIKQKDELGAIRAENCRSFRYTEVSPGVCEVDYVCSINLKGWVPQERPIDPFASSSQLGFHLFLGVSALPRVMNVMNAGIYQSGRRPDAAGRCHRHAVVFPAASEVE